MESTYTVRQRRITYNPLNYPYVLAACGYCAFALISARRVIGSNGVVGLLYDWGIPGTDVAIKHLIATSWSSYNPINLGSFSIFGQGPVWQYAPLFFSYAGISPQVLTRMLLVAPIVAGGIGAMMFARSIIVGRGEDFVEIDLWAFLIGLIYVCCGDGFFIVSDGAVPLLWFYALIPWILCLTLWAARHGESLWRLMILGLFIGIAITILEMSWFLIPISAAVYIAESERCESLLKYISKAAVTIGLLLAASMIVNSYWLIHLGWIEFDHKSLLTAVAAGNSGLEYAKTAPSGVMGFGLTGSVPGMSASFINNSPLPLVSLYVPFAVVIMFLALMAFTYKRRVEIVAIFGFIILAVLSAGEHVLGLAVTTIWSLAIMTPFRGFVHLELLAAILMCAIMITIVASENAILRSIGKSLIVCMAVVFSLPWVSGNIGGNGSAVLAPRLRTFQVDNGDLRKLTLLDRRRIGVLNIPTSGSVYYWSEDRNGNYGWRSGGLNTTVEYSLYRGLDDLNGGFNGTPSEVRWFDQAPFEAKITAKELATAMVSWDLGEVRVSRHAAAVVPDDGSGYLPVPATEALVKLTRPYFIPNGTTAAAYYFRVNTKRLAWAQCLEHCKNHPVLSRNPRMQIRVVSVDSIIRIAQVNTGDVTLSCVHGKVSITSRINSEIVAKVNCPERVVELSFESASVDSLADTVCVAGVLVWLAIVVTCRRRSRRC